VGKVSTNVVKKLKGKDHQGGDRTAVRKGLGMTREGLRKNADFQLGEKTHKPWTRRVLEGLYSSTRLKLITIPAKR